MTEHKVYNAKFLKFDQLTLFLEETLCFDVAYYTLTSLNDENFLY